MRKNAKKKLLAVALIGTLLCSTALSGIAVAADGIMIDEKNFPDAAFREYVKQFDKNPQDDSLSTQEIEAVDYISLKDKTNITDVTGIAHFYNLGSMDISGTGVTKLDLSGNPYLAVLSAQHCPLTEINLTNSTNLQLLYLVGSKVEEIDLKNCPKLKDLFVSMTPIKTLDVSKNPELYRIFARSCTNLTDIDVSQNPKLQYLFVDSTPITKLDLTGNPALISVNLDRTQITDIDLSQNSKLQGIAVSNTAITEFDTSKNPDLTTADLHGSKVQQVDFSQNPNLQGVDARDTPLTKLDLSVNDKVTILGITGSSITDLTLPANIVLQTALMDVTVDLETIPQNGYDLKTKLPNIDSTKISNLQGADIKGTTISNYKDGTPITYDYATGNTNYPIKTTLTFTVTEAVKPESPSLKTTDDGGAVVTPIDVNSDTLEVTYTPEGKTQSITLTATKADGKWSIADKPTLVEIDEQTGQITIPKNEVKDNSEVSALSKAGTMESDPVKATVGAPLEVKSNNVTVVEKKEITNQRVVEPSKDTATITTKASVNGLSIDEKGNLVGTPTITDWANDQEETRVIIVSVTVKNGTEEHPVDVKVTVQRDTDGDGIPDITDEDDDNDGIKDVDDKNPKVVDKTDPTTEPATESATEPATEPTTEPTTEPATEPATEPTTEAETNPTTEPATEAETKPVATSSNAAKNGSKSSGSKKPSASTNGSVGPADNTNTNTIEATTNTNESMVAADNANTDVTESIVNAAMKGMLPKTGDMMNLNVTIAGLIGSLTGLVGLVASKKRKKS